MNIIILYTHILICKINVFWPICPFDDKRIFLTFSEDNSLPRSTQMAIFSNKINLTFISKKLLKRLQVKVSSDTCDSCLKDHPEYPSLLSLSDCLTEWKIDNSAYRIDKKEYNSDDLLFPFIAHLPEKGGRFILINSFKDKIYSYSDESKKNGKLTEFDFLNRWEGIALHAEATVKSGEDNFNKNLFRSYLHRSILPLGLLVFALGIYLAFSERSLQWPLVTLGFIKISGIIISILLLIQSLNSANPFIQNLCGLSGKNDCNAILKSDAANVTSWLSWSEVGFFYFTGSFLLLISQPISVSLLSILNLLALPYILYSIGYQYIFRNWCILCCTVQVILVLESINFVILNMYKFDFYVLDYRLLLFCFLLPVFLWSILKPVFFSAGQLKQLAQQLKKFKYNSDLFYQALQNQSRYNLGDELMPISLGNPDAKTIITMVSNPFCEPCARAHKIINEWLQYRNDVQLKIVFTTANSEEDPKTKVVRHLGALNALKDKSVIERALNEWYNMPIKQYNIWAENYPIIFNKEMELVIKVQKDWCEMANIVFTPTILINGYKLPEPYRLEDIKYLLT